MPWKLGDLCSKTIGKLDIVSYNIAKANHSRATDILSELDGAVGFYLYIAICPMGQVQGRVGVCQASHHHSFSLYVRDGVINGSCKEFVDLSFGLFGGSSTPSFMLFCVIPLPTFTLLRHSTPTFSLMSPIQIL